MHKNITVAAFASILSKDCLTNNYSVQDPPSLSLTIGGPSQGAGVCSVSTTSVTDDNFLSSKRQKTDEEELLSQLL